MYQCVNHKNGLCVTKSKIAADYGHRPVKCNGDELGRFLMKCYECRKL